MIRTAESAAANTLMQKRENERPLTAIDDINPSYLNALDYGNYGIFLIIGNAGFKSSTVLLYLAKTQSSARWRATTSLNDRLVDHSAHAIGSRNSPVRSSRNTNPHRGIGTSNWRLHAKGPWIPSHPPLVQRPESPKNLKAPASLGRVDHIQSTWVSRAAQLPFL